MAKIYEGATEILSALNKRGCAINQEHLSIAMNELGIHGALDDQAIEELVDHLAPHLIILNKSSAKVHKRLASRPWQDSVVQARQRLRMPVAGFSMEIAEEHHDDLLRAISGSSTIRPQSNRASVFQFWGRLVGEASALCYLIGLDPSPLDRLKSAFNPPIGNYSPVIGRPIDAEGSSNIGGNLLIGLRKLINPEGVFKLDGKEIWYQPSPTDRLMAHILWGLPLSHFDLPIGPSITYTWELTPDGGGRFYESTFRYDQATASDIRELQGSLRKIKRELRYKLLINFLPSKPWKVRWRIWNQKFPDFFYPSAGAMRKAKDYLERGHNPG